MTKFKWCHHRSALSALLMAALLSGASVSSADADVVKNTSAIMPGEILPTGKRITPTAAAGSQLQSLNPDNPADPGYTAGQAVDMTISPDGKTLLVLTSGFNRMNDAAGKTIPELSTEYVFVYDISGNTPVKTQVIPVANTFNGLVWNPDGTGFYVSGGVDDTVHVFARAGSGWRQQTRIDLGHVIGEGIDTSPMAAGMAVNPAGNRLLVANYANDSVSLIDLVTRSKLAEQDLRPGKIDPARRGVAGGTYPFAVVFAGNAKAYVSSQRDRELVVLAVAGNTLAVTNRIGLDGQPNKMTINRAQTRLYVASDNSDTVVVVDTGADRIVEEIRTTAPHALFPGLDSFKGAAPNNVALSPDEGTLFVTNGGTNSVAVIQLCHALQQPEQDDDDGDNGDDDGLDDTGCNRQQASRVIGLIPTGWYPNAVSVSPDGSILYTVNGKTNAGPNPRGCRASLSIAAGSMDVCRSANQYIWQLEKAGLQSMPMPDAAQLAGLTRQVAYNNNFPGAVNYARESATLAFLRERIRHVIYVVKENRTYDQILGDLEVGNGDPELAILAPYSPNHKKLARSFVTLDNFYDSGEASSTGWNWTTAARTTDFTEKTAPVNYAGRGLTRDWEGLNRNIYVSAPTPAERKIPNPASPDDPDILAGTADVAAPDGPGGEAGAGYLWDAALRAGLSVRNYGFYGGMKRYSLPASDPGFIPLTATPYADNSVQFFARKQSLTKISDPYFRGYDMKYPDYWRFQEWEREFDEFAARGELPNLMLVRLSHDHFGDFSRAAAGVDTVETQMADNDYALGLLVEKVAHSVFRDDTLIFIIEDDAQNGGDHVDAHRSIGYVIGPYVRQGAVVSTHYTTVSMLRTMEEVLGLPPLGINDGLTAPMVDVFDRNQHDWDYRAVLPQVLLSTDLVLRYDPDTIVAAGPAADCGRRPLRSAEYWQRSMSGQNFSVEDELDTPRFNQALWAGFKGDAMPVPTVRHGRDLSSDRARLLQDYAEKRNRECHSLRALR